MDEAKLEGHNSELPDFCSKLQKSTKDCDRKKINSKVLINDISLVRRKKSLRSNWQSNLSRTTALISGPLYKLITLIVLNSILSQPNYVKTRIDQPSQLTSFLVSQMPSIIIAGALECNLDDDCESNQVCHENRCICARNRPIEDQDRCLPLSLIGEQCAVSEQCLGNSQCVDGVCSCGNEAISLFNPSTKIFYCHPKRGLNEECNHDSQCPSNSYCSSAKSGCLCQNGFAEQVVNSSGKESRECLAKFCVDSSTCESEFHECEENKCKCLAAHFDPTTAKCYKFGSTGGKPAEELLDAGGNNVTSITSEDNNIYTFFKDLTENGDKMWLVLVILISLSIIIFVLIFILVRKYYLGYCWTAHKKEYEPNNKSPPKNGYFNKNSINNKSFRQKNGEMEDDEDDSAAADRSNLVSSKQAVHTNNRKKDNHYVKVSINDHQHNESNENQQYLQMMGPLATSTSTPV